MITLAATHRHEVEIKKSRFIAIAGRTDCLDDVESFLDAYRDLQATHNCFAYRIQEIYRFFDDGEPGGTAGRPILAAIDAQGVQNVTILLIRHYGGIKLGSGGLARAYGGTAAQCIQGAPKVEVLPKIVVNFSVPFDHVGSTYQVLERMAARKMLEMYKQDGVHFQAEFLASDLVDFKKNLADATRGAGRLLEGD